MVKYLNFLILIVCVAGIMSCSKSKKENNIPEEDQHFQNAQNPRLNALNEAIEDDTDNGDLYYRRSKVYFEEKKYRTALNDVNSAIHYDNTNAGYYIHLARIYKALGKTKQALKIARQAESMNSQDPELFILMAQLYFETKDEKNAEYYLNQSAILAPLHAEIFVLKGNVLAHKGDTTRSLEQYYQALEKDKENIDALKSLASIYASRKKFDSSMVFVLRGKALDKNEPVFDYVHGRVLEHLNLSEAAKVSYINAVNADSSFYLASVNLGNLYLKAGKVSEAYGCYQNALKYNDEIVSANLHVAEILESSGREGESIPYLERVALVDTNNMKVRTNLKRLYGIYGKATIEPHAGQLALPKQDSTHTTRTPVPVRKNTGAVRTQNAPVARPAAGAEENNLPPPNASEEVKPTPQPAVRPIESQAEETDQKEKFKIKSIFKKKKKNQDTVE